MRNENKIPLTPHRMNFFGRKRYSVDVNASDYLDYNLDDIWNAIKKLWIAVFISGILIWRIIISAMNK